MSSTYSLALAAVVVTLHGGVVVSAVDASDCTKQLDLCMPKDGSCKHCTHVQTKNKPLWRFRNEEVPQCLTFGQWSQMWEDHGSTNHCRTSNASHCTAMTNVAEKCYVTAASKGKAAVTGSRSGPWTIQLRNMEGEPINQRVKGTIYADYTEIRSGQGLYGDYLRDTGTSRGFTIAVRTVCTDCPTQCTFENTLSLYAISPDPHRNSAYNKGTGPQELYDTVAPKTAAASTLLIRFNGEETECAAAQIPVEEYEVKWKGVTYTLTQIARLGNNQHTCNEWHGKGLCGDFQYQSLDKKPCVGRAHCRAACCSCGSDDPYYASWCPYYVSQGYCKHTYVSWMKHYCDGSCCKAASG